MRRILPLVLVACLLACGESVPLETTPADPPSDPSPTSTPDEPTTPPTVPPPLDGLDGLEAPPEPGELAPSAAIDGAAPEGARTCVVASETRGVLPGAGRTAVVAGYLGQAFVAAYVREGESESVAVVRVISGSEPELFTRIALERPVTAPRGAAPGLSMHDGTLLLSAIDGGGRLLFGALDASIGGVAGRFTTTIDDAHADARFSPTSSISEDGTRLVAWTDGSGTPMRVRLARIAPSGSVLDAVVVSPDGGGAAPVFGLGDRARVLYLVEARIAMSAAHRVGIGADGTPAPVEVARPLLRGAELPSIAVVRGAEGTRTHLAYAAVGNLATRAIGLVQTTGTDSPAPLVAGLGYGGAITVRAAPLRRSVVFAMEAPSAAEPTAPHDVRVRVVADDGAMGEPLILTGQIAPAIALVAHDDDVATLVISSEGARVTFVRCTE